jgi:hypothetical protein
MKKSHKGIGRRVGKSLLLAAPYGRGGLSGKTKPHNLSHNQHKQWLKDRCVVTNNQGQQPASVRGDCRCGTLLDVKILIEDIARRLAPKITRREERFAEE